MSAGPFPHVVDSAFKRGFASRATSASAPHSCATESEIPSFHSPSASNSLSRDAVVGSAFRRGLAFCLGRVEKQSFHSPAASESLSFACPKESNQRKGHPASAVFGPPALRRRERAPGFADGTSVCRHRTGRRPAGPPAGCSSTRPPRLRGPMERASCAPKTNVALHLPLLLLLRAGRARSGFERAPCGHAEERSRQPGKGKLSGHRDVRVVCRPADGEHRRAPDGQEPGRRGRWGGLLLTPGILPFALRAGFAVRAAPAAQWLLSLGHSRESDSLAAGE